MPELPEVETVMRGLAARLDGRILVRAEVRRPDLRWAFPPNLAARLTGARVQGFRRRAKYMLMRLDGGDSVLIHLGMSGRMLIRRRGSNEPVLHEHVALETDDGWEIGFVDPRRFGSVDLVPTASEDNHRLLAGLGPEPLDRAFSPKVLRAALEGRRTPIKAALLDQRVGGPLRLAALGRHATPVPVRLRTGRGGRLHGVQNQACVLPVATLIFARRSNFVPLLVAGRI